MNWVSKAYSYVASSLGFGSGDLISEGNARWFSGASAIASDTMAGEPVSQESMMQSATCFACTAARSETVAGLPGMVFREFTNRREEDYNSQAYGLLTEQPNAEMDAFTFWEMLTTRLTNRGNFFAEIERNERDEPVALWPIHNSRVEPMRDPVDKSLYYQISSDYSGNPRWDDPTWRREHTFSLGPHNMLNVVGFNSPNGIMAPGIIPAAEEIGMDAATRRYGGKFFKNDATPSGMVTHPTFYKDPNQRAIFREDLNRVHNNKTGSSIGVLWDGATYEQISIAPEQAQFLQTRKFTADQICKFYGVPPAIIGDMKDSKFANADAMIRHFVMITLRNLCVRIEKAINRQVLNVRNDQGKLVRAFSKPQVFELALEGLLRGDPKTQAEVAHTLRFAGVTTTNEVREQFDYNPIEGPEGEYRVVPGGTTRLDKIDNQGTRVDQAGSNTDDAKPKKTKAAAEYFNKESLIEGLQQIIDQNGGPTVRGATLGPDANEVLTDAMIDLAQTEVARIHKITLTQIERWREQDPKDVAAKMPKFWESQHARVWDALQPVERMSGKRTNAPAEPLYALTVADLYRAHFIKFDNYSIFDSANHDPDIDVAAIIRG